MIINHYLAREIIKPLLMGSVILVVIFASYRSSIYLAEATKGLLPMETVLNLILLRIVISLEMLLPTALYLAVVVGLGRLYKDSEMIALNALGVSELQILKTVFRFSVVVAIVVGVLSIYGRPWAYRISYFLEAKAEAEFDISMMQAGHFFELADANRVLYARRIDREEGRMKDVFVQSDLGDATQVIYAREAYLPPLELGDAPTLVFLDGSGYQLDREGRRDRTLVFNKLTVHLDSDRTADSGYKRKAESTANLAKSVKPKEIAEYQWRLSTPLTTLILGMLGVPLSRVPPREGNYGRLFVAVLVYAAFFNLTGMARTWVEQGQVGAMPGIWWVHVLLSGVLILLVYYPLMRTKK